MNSSIASAVSSVLTPEIIGKVATASALDRSITQKAVSAAVPTILICLAELVHQPGGARKLSTVLAEQPADILESISSSLIGPAHAAAKGNNLLSSLLGSSAPGLLSSAIGRFIGISGAMTQTVLGLMAPIVLGGLGRFQRTRGLDADGLAQVLTEQQDDIADTLPPGVSGYLGRTGLVGSAGVHKPIPRAYDKRSELAGSQSTERTAYGAAGSSWPYWALAVAALGGLSWILLPPDRDADEISASTSPALRISVPARNAHGKAVYITQPARNWVSIGTSPNDYVNRDIYSLHGEVLGTVRDLLTGPDGKPTAAVINVGQYLGIGDKDIAVPFTAIRMEQRERSRRMVIDLAKDALQSAPSYEDLPASR